MRQDYLMNTGSEILRSAYKIWISRRTRGLAGVVEGGIVYHLTEEENRTGIHRSFFFGIIHSLFRVDESRQIGSPRMTSLNPHSRPSLFTSRCFQGRCIEILLHPSGESFMWELLT